MPATTELVVALRFRPRDAASLAVIAAMTGEDQGAFHRAAQSAANDEPLIIRATTREEIEHFADRIQTYGISRPAIDELTDPRWDNNRR